MTVPTGGIHCDVDGDLASINFPGKVLIEKTKEDLTSLLSRSGIAGSEVDLLKVREGKFSSNLHFFLRFLRMKFWRALIMALPAE